MIIDFKFSNILSYKSEQLFSMQKTATRMDDNTLTYKDSVFCNRIAAIYGANAAGKTNFIKTFRIFVDLISGAKDVEDLKVSQFASNDDSASNIYISFRPSKSQNKYDYYISFNTKKIISEKLNVYKSSKATCVFSIDRKSNKNRYGIVLSEDDKNNIKTYSNNYKKTVLSQLFQLEGVNKLKNKIILDVASFFMTEVIFNPIFENASGSEVTKITTKMRDNKNVFDFLCRTMPVADFGISSIDLVNAESGMNDKQKEIMSKAIIDVMRAGSKKFTKDDEEFVKQSFNEEVKKIIFNHKIGKTMRQFSVDDESRGTIAMSSILVDILPILKNGGVYIVDEIDKSLHPLLLSQLVRIFNNKDTNPNGAQLIFTTHDATLLDSSIYGEEIIKRDEVWFVEKNICGESGVYPLTSFKNTTRKSDNLYKKYIAGVYGAYPKASLYYAVLSYWSEEE